MNYKLTVAWLYPDMMSTYGDRGNIIVLERRCRWRGIEVNLNEITLETDAAELKKCDLIFMGGAQDRQQKLAARDFLENKGPQVKKMIEKNIPALFVCAAFQQAGHFYRPYQGDKIKGASIFDLETLHPGDQAKRLIGNTAAKLLLTDLKDYQIVGFENHGGRTHLGQNIKPLAKVIKGYGNNGEDGYEGAIYKNALGSYYHGPILAKNPLLSDWLIAKALEVKYASPIKLATLPDALEKSARKVIFNRLNLKL